MKRILLITLLLVAILTHGAAANQVTIKLTTSVPEVLVHGFLAKDTVPDISANISASASYDDAFNSEGVEFTYAVKTNTSIPMTVYASITPFEQQQTEVPAHVNIDQISVQNKGSSSGSAVIELTSGYEEPYRLIELKPDQGGMAVYAYTLTVIANATDVASAPAGEYKSTVSIGITTGN